MFVEANICRPDVKAAIMPVAYDLNRLGLATIDPHLRNRFHVAVRLFSNRSQMTSKCGKNKKVAHEA